MIDLNQNIQVTWCPSNREHYEKLGYQYKYRGKFLVTVKELTPQSDKLVVAICDYCGDSTPVKWCNYLKSTKDLTEKYCCKKCKGLKAHEKNYNPMIYYQKYVDACIEKGYTPLSPFSEFHGTEKSVLRIYCKKHGEQTANYRYVVNSQVCKECGKEKYPVWNKKSQQQVSKIIESKNGNTWLNTNEYINVNTPNLLIKCGSCGRQFTTSLSSIMNSGGRCMKCKTICVSDFHRLDPDDVKMRIELSGENKLLNPEDYVSNAVQNLIVSCTCGNTYKTSLVRYENGRTRCDKCTRVKSSGECLVESILNKYNIIYKSEHRFQDCKDKTYLPFDFYLPEYNKCIEFDGQGHYQPVFGEEVFESTIKHDIMKNEYCKTYGIELLRIPFWEFDNVEQIISNFLGLTKYPKIIRYHKNPYKREST